MSARRPREEKYSINVRGIPAEVALKNIRHMYIRVFPGAGGVKVSAPFGAGPGEIMEFADSKFEWMRKRLREGEKNRRRPLNYVSGETHYFEGRPFRLEVVEDGESPPVRVVPPSRMELRAPPGSTAAVKKRTMEEWMRSELKKKIPPLIKKWEAKTGLSPAEWRIRRMKTRWGTCSVREKRLWFNLELAKKPPESLEYIVVHELLHLREARHGPRYKALLERFLPDWRLRKRELDNFPE